MERASGVWQLIVDDQVDGDDGSLYRFKLTLHTLRALAMPTPTPTPTPKHKQ